jgi:NAD(P)H-hydrate epimerase
MMDVVSDFDKRVFHDLWRPDLNSGKFSMGQVTIVGGSSLFHGAPILALRLASRCVGMVYWAAPETEKEVADILKAGLSSFIWVSRDDLKDYIKKSDAVLVGPGLMRNHRESDGVVCDIEGRRTRELTLSVFAMAREKKLVVDGGSLQVVEVDDIPKGAVITPNRKEYEMLFRETLSDDEGELVDQIMRKARAYSLTILHKGKVSVISNGEKVVKVYGGSLGMVKGGTGDVIAGLVVGLLAKNEVMVAVSAASFLVNLAAERLENRQGVMFNADDLALEVTRVYGEMM